MESAMHGWDDNCPPPWTPPKTKGPTGVSSDDEKRSPADRRRDEVAEEQRELEGRRPTVKKLR